MFYLALKAYVGLIYFDLYLASNNFPPLYTKVQRCPIRKKAWSHPVLDQISAAVNVACIWYWKEALCLQRSAATTCLMRSQGIPAELVLGAQTCPFRAHAWVEVEGQVVNDKPYMQEIYAVLDRC